MASLDEFAGERGRGVHVARERHGGNKDGPHASH